MGKFYSEKGGFGWVLIGGCFFGEVVGGLIGSGYFMWLVWVVYLVFLGWF